MYHLPGSIRIRLSFSRLVSDDGTITAIDANDKDENEDEYDKKFEEEGGGKNWEMTKISSK